MNFVKQFVNITSGTLIAIWKVGYDIEEVGK
jgi:hypothetical protein